MSSADRWQQARLIPTSGISGQDEQEARATSALLAVLPVVRDFAGSLLRPLGAPTGSIETFIEVPFETPDGRSVRPDGLIRVTRGQRSWVALVEVKTGSAELQAAQIESYLDVARAQGFDAVLTLSNQISTTPGVHPVDVDKRRLKKVALHHYSWPEVVAAAVNERVHRGLQDPEQAFILSELIRYLEHPKSGAADFSDMGATSGLVVAAPKLGVTHSVQPPNSPNHSSGLKPGDLRCQPVTHLNHSGPLPPTAGDDLADSRRSGQGLRRT